MLKSLLSAAAVSAALLLSQAAAAAAPVINVYKTATCGCCKAWVEHLQHNGFTVHAHDVEAPAVMRAKFGIPEQYGSCHTGIVNGYAVEGHVPAAVIKRLLKEKPKASGLAVPGMPMGSPGMEGDHSEAYDVMLISKKGKATVYQHVKAN
jgi:hypothetical protein